MRHLHAELEIDQTIYIYNYTYRYGLRYHVMEEGLSAGLGAGGKQYIKMAEKSPKGSSSESSESESSESDFTHVRTARNIITRGMQSICGASATSYNKRK